MALPGTKIQHARLSSRRLFTLFASVAGACLVGGIFLFKIEITPAWAVQLSSAVPVETANPTTENVPVYLDGLGTVQAENTVNIIPRIDGQLITVNFTEGQQVKKGDLLAVIDPRPFQAALNQANAKIAQDNADLVNARFLLEKDKKLAGQQIVTAEALEQQQAQVDALQAQLGQDEAARDSAAVSLSYTEIRSPIDGRTGIRQVDAGNQVHATDTVPIVTITQTDPISLISTLRETDLSDVQKAMNAGPVQVVATTVDGSQHLGDGKVLLVDNEIDLATGTIRIKSTFANPDQKLWPGQSVLARVLQKTELNTLTVPSPAIQRGPDGFFVYTINAANQAEVTKVDVGPIENGRATIKNGLSSKDQVVVTGQYRLAPGVQVNATPAKPAAPKDQ